MTDASGPSNASPPASTSSDDLTNLRSSVDFSPLTVQKDRRYGVVTAFSDSLAFIYWDESEGNWIFRPELAAFGCGVVYQPEQFGWLVEAEEIVKNGEEVNWPSDYSDEEKAGLVAVG